MKKLLLTILSCLMLVSCCLLGGCGSQEVYKLSKIKDYDYERKTDVTIELGDEYYGLELQEDTFMLIVDGDTAFLRFCEVEEDGEKDIEVYAFQWKEGYDNEYYAYSEDKSETSIAKKDGNQISFDFEGATFIFEK